MTQTSVLSLNTRISPRLIFSITLLAVALTSLILYLIPRGPAVVSWIPPDYVYFLDWGNNAQSGVYAYRYPLPTLLWVFLPLSLLPSWFALIWVAMPFLYLLWLFGKKGVVLWLSYPLLVQTAQGQIDGWFLLPVYWLVNDHPLLAGISAGLLTLKPQLGVFTVPFMVYHWLKKRNRKSLLLFGGTIIILYLPAFVVDPFWPLKMIPEGQLRASESIQQTRGATLWTWWWREGWTQWALPLVLVLVFCLLIRAFRDEWKQARAVHLLGLLSVPVLYALSFSTAMPVLEKSYRHLTVFTVVSWLSVALDVLFSGWGGAYVLTPITALWLVAKQGEPDEAKAAAEPLIQPCRTTT